MKRMWLKDIYVLGLNENVVTMICDNLYSQNFNAKLCIWNNEPKLEYVAYTHPEINLEVINGKLNFDELSVFLGVYKAKTKMDLFHNIDISIGNFINIIHKNTEISKTASYGVGNLINAQVVITGHSKIGNFVSLNRSTSIGHHSVIGDFCTINPGVTICGYVELGEGTTIGAGATVVDGVRIGKNVTVGAGSLVLKDLPDNCMAFGSPINTIKY
jgi:sugar O-acyltransferase (sialic acid O-acetyltransferase NeuD family)